MHTTLEQPALLDALRQAFARGDGQQGDTLLLAALESELPWDCVARTVAEGVALRYGGKPHPDQPASGQRADRPNRGPRRRLGLLVLTDPARRTPSSGQAASEQPGREA